MHDSPAALAKLGGRTSEQEAPIGRNIWSLVSRLATDDRPFLLQWVRSRCGLPCGYPCRPSLGAAPRGLACRRAYGPPSEGGPFQLHRRVETRMVPVAHGGCPPATSGEAIRQIHSHRHLSDPGGPLPTFTASNKSRRSVATCEPCEDPRCRASWCLTCGEETDSLEHALHRCPALMRARFRLFGTFHPTLEDIRRDDSVAALVGPSGSSRAAEPRSAKRVRREQQQQITTTSTRRRPAFQPHRHLTLPPWRGKCTRYVKFSPKSGPGTEPAQHIF